MHFSFKSLWAHEIRVHNNGSNPSKCILCVQNIKLKLKVFHFNFLLWCHMQGCLQNFFIEVAIWGPLKILGWHPNNRMSCFIVLLSNIGHSKIMIKKREKELYAQLMTWGLTGQIWGGGAGQWSARPTLGGAPGHGARIMKTVILSVSASNCRWSLTLQRQVISSCFKSLCWDVTSFQFTAWMRRHEKNILLSHSWKTDTFLTLIHDCFNTVLHNSTF